MRTPVHRIAPVLAGLTLLPVGAIAVPEPEATSLVPPGDRAGVFLSLGLDRDAERVLRARLAAGEAGAREPVLNLLMRNDRVAEAEALVEGWGGPDSIASPADHFVWGRLLELGERWEEAAAAYETSASSEPLLSDHAAYRAAIAREKAGDPAAALDLYERAGEAARDRSVAARAYWAASGAALAVDDPGRALAALERVPRRSAIDRADLLDREAQIHRALGQSAREARALRDLVDRSPSSDAALAAVDRLSAIEPPSAGDRVAFGKVALASGHASRAEKDARAALGAGEEDPVLEGQARLLLGKALLARRRYTAAREELERLPGDAHEDERGEAALDRARCLWRLGQIDACLAEYDRIADGEWPEEVRAAASWEAGREAKDNRRWEEAALRFSEFQRLFPEHDRADDAAWHRGRALAELGRNDDALDALELLRARYPDSRFVAEATYWAARTHRDRGDGDAACVEYARLLEHDADSFWAERARSRLAESACPPDSVREVHGPWADPLEWLAEEVEGVDPPADRVRAERLEGSERFRRARTLAGTGLVSEAEAELGGLRRALEGDSAALLGFAQKAWGAGIPREAMRAILVVKARTQKRVLSGDLPAEVARLLYPVGYLDSVLRWSREYELDPWFVYAVMREESWFDHEAVSWAGAHGLLQIMPQTGRDLARRVGLHRFVNTDLFEPEVNIRLGTFYLSELLDDLESEPALALSAYNAGKGNALRWRKNVDGDFDLDRYVAGITYGETYGYVQRVTRTWAIYRLLYDGLLERFGDLAAERDDPTP